MSAEQIDWPASFIDDGYTEEGYIAGVAGIHGPLSFTYRPMLPETRDRLLRSQQRDIAAGHKEARTELAKHVQDWDLKDRKGNAVPKTAANIGQLRPLIQDKLFSIVAGQIASDVNPDKETADEDEPVHKVEESLKN